MLVIENSFFGNPNFGIVSISIDPEHDTPVVLKSHRELLGAKSANWNFLTGDKTYIYDLANKGFNVFVGENHKVKGGFEHSGLFALIDKKGISVAEKTILETQFCTMMVWIKRA